MAPLGCAGRGREQTYSTVSFVALSAWAARIVQAGSQIAVMPLLVRLLGTESYAVVVILQSLAAWLLLSDLGIGSAVQNLLSQARARGDDERPILSSAAVLVCGLLLTMAVILAASSSPLQSLLFRRFEQVRSVTLPPVVLVGGLLYLVAGIGSVAYRVYYGQQRGYLAHCIQALGSIGLLIWVLLLPKHGSDSTRLVLATMAIATPPAIAASVAAAHALGKCWQSRFVTREMVVLIARRSAGFAAFSLLAAAAIQMDYFVMSQTSGVDDVVVYAIITKIFSLAFVFYSVVLMAAWPKWSEESALGRLEGAGRALKSLLIGGWLLVIAVGVGTFFLRVPLIRLLAPGTNLQLHVMTIILCTCYFLIRVWSDTFSILLQSANRMKVLLVVVPIQSLFAIFLQYFLSMRYGLNGILGGLIGAFLLTTVWVGPLEYRNLVSTGNARCRGLP